MKEAAVKIWIWLVLFIAICCGDSKETRLQRFLIQSNTLIEHHQIEQAERYLREAIKAGFVF